MLERSRQDEDLAPNRSLGTSIPLQSTDARKRNALCGVAGVPIGRSLLASPRNGATNSVLWEVKQPEKLWLRHQFRTRISIHALSICVKIPTKKDSFGCLLACLLACLRAHLLACGRSFVRSCFLAPHGRLVTSILRPRWDLGKFWHLWDYRVLQLGPSAPDHGTIGQESNEDPMSALTVALCFFPGSSFAPAVLNGASQTLGLLPDYWCPLRL